jgi:RNA polymerase sigma factor (sigma-70 family)
MATGFTNGLLRQLRRAALRRAAAELTDAQLLGHFLTRGDEAAFEALLRRHGPMVLALCRRVLGNAHDAEDAFQATFLVFLRKAAAIRSREAIGNWLYGVAYRTALAAKVAAAKRRLKEGTAAARAASAAAGEGPWEELQPLLDQELSRLPDKYRVPLVLCDLQGLTHREAAGQLGWPEGTVSGRLARARRLLAARLARRGITIGGAALGAALARAASASPVPPTLAISTTQAVTGVAAGSAAAAGAVPVAVAELTQGVLKAMSMSKLRVMAAALLAVSALGTGLGVWHYRTRAAEPVFVGEERPAPAAAAAAPRPDQSKTADKKTDKDRLQGTWTAVSGEQLGEAIPQERLKDLRLDIRDGKASFRLTGEDAQGTFKAYPLKNQLQVLDLTDGTGRRLLALYEFDRENLKLCFAGWNTTPPARFDGRGHTVVVFKKTATQGGKPDGGREAPGR